MCVIPGDRSRVILEYINDDIDSDYINASYIHDIQQADTYCHCPKYIAAQGPLSTTINDFWRMVWQEQVKCIVMLTDIFTFSKVST